MKKYIHLVTASVLLASLTACSQQQVAGGSQQAAAAKPDASAAKDDAHCRGCNAPKIEAVVKPAAVAKPAPRPRPVAAAKPRPVPTAKPYQARQHVPTVPNKKNASSSLVRSIQNALVAKGYNAGTTDGVMGARTASALSAFQRANNLPNGINQPTLRALGIK